MGSREGLELSLVAKRLVTEAACKAALLYGVRVVLARGPRRFRQHGLPLFDELTEKVREKLDEAKK